MMEKTQGVAMRIDGVEVVLNVPTPATPMDIAGMLHATKQLSKVLGQYAVAAASDSKDPAVKRGRAGWTAVRKAKHAAYMRKYMKTYRKKR